METIIEAADLVCIIQTVTISRKLETLKNKLDSKKNLSNVDLQPFRQLCCNKDPHIAKLSCDFIVNFVKQNKLSTTEAMAWFISSLQSTENINVTITAIKDLLLGSFRSQNSKEHACPFGLISPQHPFILILKQDNAHWPVIDCHIQHMFKTKKPIAVFNMLAPFFKYVLWSPPGNVDHGCKRSLWKLLVNNFSADYSDFVSKTVSWLRIDEENSVLNASYYLNDLLSLETNVDTRQKVNFICVFSTEIACKAARLSHDPSLALTNTKEILKKFPETTDIVLILIAESLSSCPVGLISKFLSTCIELINENGISDVIIVWMIISAILPWIIHPMSITKDISVTANSLFNIIEGKRKVASRKASVTQLENDSWFIECITSYTESYWAFVVAREIETSSFGVLLEQISNYSVPSDVVRENFIVNLVVSAVFLNSDDLHIQLSALDILIEKNAGFQLSLILFILSRTSHPELHLKLLQSLPLTAVVKENISCILATIRSLSSSRQPVLVQLSYSLYSTLWKTEERCYQFLYDQIMNFMTASNTRNHDYELDIVVASVICDICTRKPETYGKEWVKVLSEIMSSYVEQCECLPLIFALKAILKMCESKVIDVFTVYEELLKKHLFSDERTKVIEQLCKMIGLMFQQWRESTTVTHEPLVIEALSIIWKIIAQSSEKEVIEAALSSLSKYDYAQMPPTVLPDKYRKNIKVPLRRAKKGRADEKEEEVSPFIPGSFWLEYLRDAPEQIEPKICELLTLWLTQEAKNFLPFMFRSIHRERDSVLALHHNSIFKAVVDNCKYFVRKTKVGDVDVGNLKIVIFCLKILNEQPEKCLPPFNWSFMEELLKYENEELRKLVLRFWAKESVTSASAKTCIEMYLKKIDVRTCNVEELEMAFEIISNFCAGIASETIASFFSILMQFILEKCCIEEYENSLYRSACKCLRTAIKYPEIDEHNCEAICKNLVIWWENAAIQNDRFDDLIDVAKEMPESYIDYLSSLSLSSQVSTEDVYKILRLRCSIAMNDPGKPFFWLNDCIEATSRRLQGKILFFECTLDVFTVHRHNESKWPWLLQFLDRIQVSADTMTDEICKFMCDVFIFCVVNTSTYHPFLRDATSIEECYEYFPQAFRNTLVDNVSSQVIEWLSHSVKIKKISTQHKQLFINAIIASRRNNYLQKLSVWSNIVQKL